MSGTTPNDLMQNMTPRQKADAVTSDMVSSGGYMSEREFERFMVQAFKKSELAAQVNRVEMPAREYEIPRLRFSDGEDDFIMVPTASREHQALGVDERSAPTFGALNLAASDFSGEVNVPRKMLRENIEKERLTDIIRGILYDRIAADVEKIGIRGDTTSLIVQLAAMDGWIAQATTNTVAAAGARLSSTLLQSALDLLPEEVDGDDVAFMTTRKSRHNYLEELRSRATPAGDVAILQGINATFDDYVIDKYKLWPQTDGGTNNRTSCLLAARESMVLGIFNEIELRVGEDLKTRDVVVVYEVSFAVGYEVEPFAVCINDILNT